MSDFTARAGKQRWSEKSAGQPIDAALGLFPNAQVVHILRDPRDVVASSLATPWTDPDPTLIARFLGEEYDPVMLTVRELGCAGHSQS